MNNYQQNGFNTNPNQGQYQNPNPTQYPNSTQYPNPSQNPNVMYYPPQQGGMPPQKNKKNNTVVIAVVCAAILVILILGIILTVNSVNKKNMNMPISPVAETYSQTESVTQSNTTADTSKKKNVDDANNSGYSRKNPAPIGVEQSFEYENSYDTEENYSAIVKIVEVVRGEEAFAMMSKYAEPAEDGYEYIAAKVAMSINSVNSDKAIDASRWDFTCFTSNNEETPSTYESAPEPQLEGKLFEGGSAEGWILFLAKIGDESPKVVYKLNYDGTGGAWFSLNQ